MSSKTVSRSAPTAAARTRKALILGSSALALLALDAGAAYAQIESTNVQEVVVTARKREETLVNVPVAVSAVSGPELSRKGTVSLTAIADQIPQMVVGRAASGAGGVIALRGVSSPPTDPGIESSVSVNIDGVQVSRGFITQASFFDLRQVEVLKGPQALFFGKNSPAGVISLTSQGPGAHIEGFAKAGYEFTADEKFFEAAIGGPINNVLGIRVAFRHSDMKGYLYNTAKPIANPFAPQYPLPGPLGFDRAPGAETNLGRITVDFRPNERLSALLKVLVSNYNDNGVTGINQVVRCAPGVVHPHTLGIEDPNSDCKADKYFTQSQLPLAIAANYPTYAQYGSKLFNDADVVLSSLRLNYDAGPVSLTSVTGVFDFRVANQGDFGYDNYIQFPGLQVEKDHIVSEEVRALTKFNGPLNFVVGAYYEDNKRRTTAVGCGRVALGPDPATGYTAGCINNDLVTSKTESGFGQAIWTVASNIELAGGVRYTKEKKHGILQNVFVNEFVLPNGQKEYANRRPSQGPLIGDFVDDNWSPEVTGSWHPAPNQTVYAAYRSGYKSGGFSTPTVLIASNTIGQLTFNSEKAHGGEIGYKAELFDRRLLLDMDIYKYKFLGLQRASLDIATTTFVIRNAADATTKGAEFSAHYQATPELFLTGGVAYNKARYGKFDSAACYNGEPAGTSGTGVCITRPNGIKTQDLSGTPLSRAPVWVLNGAIDYSHEIAGGWAIGVNGDVKYSGRYLTQDDGDANGYQDHYTKLNASIRLYQPNGHWDIGFVGRNLTNTTIILVTSGKPGGNPGELSGAIERPRELILQTTYRF